MACRSKPRPWGGTAVLNALVGRFQRFNAECRELPCSTFANPVPDGMGWSGSEAGEQGATGEWTCDEVPQPRLRWGGRFHARERA